MYLLCVWWWIIWCFLPAWESTSIAKEIRGSNLNSPSFIVMFPHGLWDCNYHTKSLYKFVKTFGRAHIGQNCLFVLNSAIRNFCIRILETSWSFATYMTATLWTKTKSAYLSFKGSSRPSRDEIMSKCRNSLVKLFGASLAFEIRSRSDRNLRRSMSSVQPLLRNFNVCLTSGCFCNGWGLRELLWIYFNISSTEISRSSDSLSKRLIGKEEEA